MIYPHGEPGSEELLSREAEDRTEKFWLRPGRIKTIHGVRMVLLQTHGPNACLAVSVDTGEAENQ